MLSTDNQDILTTNGYFDVFYDILNVKYFPYIFKKVHRKIKGREIKTKLKKISITYII